MTNFEDIKNMTIDQFADWLIGQKGLNVGHGTDAWKYHMEVTVNWLNQECSCPCTETCKCTEWRATP